MTQSEIIHFGVLLHKVVESHMCGINPLSIIPDNIPAKWQSDLKIFAMKLVYNTPICYN